MDFKLVDKKNMGVVALLLLVIILSQSRFFNFLIDTALGRAFLIAFIIFISCCHKIMGIVGVLLIIIMFNKSGIGILEGFDAGQIKAKMDASGAVPPTPTPAPTPATTTSTSTSTLDASGSTVDASGSVPSNSKVPNLSEIQKQLHSKIAEAQAQAQSAQGQAKEGFDLIGTESSIKSGKQSNSISVNHKTKSSENVSPSEENIFSTSSYSKF